MSSFQAIRRLDLDPSLLLKIFTVIPVVLIFLAGAGTLWIYFFVLSLLPESQAGVDMPGLSADVQVVRDKNGVPGIIGNTEEDLALVLGYVMAQDRLWQMDFLRRASQGRLAEILGARYLPGDHLARTLRVAMADKRPADQTTERQNLWLDHFVRGVNRFISTHARKLPVEFSILEYRPEPFTVEDVHGILMAVATESSPALRIDPVLARLSGRLGEDRIRALRPGDPAAPQPLVISGLKGWDPEGPLFRRAVEGVEPVRAPALRGGCAWAIRGEDTREGKGLAAWLVYQALTAPGFWYRARMTTEGFHLSGAFIPGVPVAVVGNNAQISWGCLTVPADDADLYVEELDANKPTGYWRHDHWVKLKEVQERFRVRGGSSGYLPVRLTREGPLVSEASDGKAFSLRWTGFGGLGAFPALHALNRARGGADVTEAMSRLAAPCMTAIWAAQSGEFGMRSAGRIPIRPPESDGVVPMPAWTGVHDWQGFVPYDELPQSGSAGRELVVSTDGRLGGADYPYLVSCYWDGPGREGRLRTLLRTGDKLDREGFQKIVADSVSTMAEELAPLLIRAAEATSRKHEVQRKAIRLLHGWDCRMAADSAPAAVFGLFHQALVEELFSGIMGDQLYGAFVGCPALASRMVRRIFVERHADWLESTTPEEMLCRSFERAIRRGESAMGSDPAKWKWGNVHKVVFPHPIAARSRFLELLYQVGPVTTAGFGDSLAYARWGSAGGRLSEGISFAQIADTGQPPSVFSMGPLGISGHFFSGHYKDQTQAWLSGKLFRDPVEGADIRRSGMTAVKFKVRRVNKRAER
ncbi:MAG: penicillin acylase family protein [Thermodesulfobacteriota bacterium]